MSFWCLDGRSSTFYTNNNFYCCTSSTSNRLCSKFSIESKILSERRRREFWENCQNIIQFSYSSQFCCFLYSLTWLSDRPTDQRRFGFGIVSSSGMCCCCAFGFPSNYIHTSNYNLFTCLLFRFSLKSYDRVELMIYELKAMGWEWIDAFDIFSSKLTDWPVHLQTDSAALL